MKSKSILWLSLIFLTLSSNYCWSGFLAPTDSFKLDGKILCNEKPLPGASVVVYSGNTKIKSTYTNRNGAFTFYFPHNKEFTIETSKNGYVTVKVGLDTKVSADIIAKGGIGETYDLNIQTLELYPQIKLDIFKNPVEVYKFSAETWFFETDPKKSKSAQVKAAATKIETEKNKTYQDAFKKGTAFLNKMDYPNALAEFSRALENKPKDDVTLEKLKEVRKQLKKQGGIDKMYQDAVSGADANFKKGAYDEAIKGYNKAISFKPDESYPKVQAAIADSILSRKFDKVKKEYEKVIAVADQKFKNKEWDAARKEYDAALLILPGDKYAKNQLTAIDNEIAAEKKKKEDEIKANEDKYKKLIKKADDLMAVKDYPNAIKTIDEALLVKPNDSDALSKKSKAEKLQEELLAKKLQEKKDKDYSDTLKLAEQAFNSKKYDIAESLYKVCASIKPKENLPVKRLKEIKNLTAQVVELKEEKTEKDTIFKDTKINKDEKLTGTDIGKQVAIADVEIKKGNIEEASKIYLNLASTLHDQDQLTKSHEILVKTLDLVKKTGDKGREAIVLNEMAAVNYDLGNYKQSVTNYQNIAEIKRQLGDKKGEADVMADMGSVLENTYQLEAAADAYTKALDIQKQLNNKEEVTTTCNKLGTVYYNQNDYEKSQQYFKEAITTAEVTNNLAVKSGLLNSMGVVSYKMGKFQDAVNYYTKAIEAGQEFTNKQNISLAYNNIGNVNYDWNKYDEAIKYYEKSLKLKKELNFEEGIAVSLFNIGSTYLAMKNTTKATEFINASLSIAKKLNLRDVLQQSYKSLSKLYEMNNDFKNAMANYKEFSSIAGPGVVSEGPIAEMTGNYERESKLVKSLRLEVKRQKILADLESMQKMQAQSKLLVKNLELENERSSLLRHRILLMFTLICMGFAGTMSLQYYRRYKEKKQFSEIIGFQKQQITDSIEYASRIQRAVMTPGEVVKSIFPDSFVLNLPKDIVSGDYFYFTTQKEKIYLAVADCTGHGVPGAFMSMLGISLIKEIIAHGEDLSTCDILNNLRDSIIKALHQSDQSNEPKDGMDIALCVIDLNEMALEYSGANNPCFVIRNKEIIELKADRMPVGIHPVIKPFISHKLKIEKNDVIYMFSDGYRDQIGESTLKKFKVANFNNLLIEIHDMPLPEQAATLYERHLAWKGGMEQTDDILIMGIRI